MATSGAETFRHDPAENFSLGKNQPADISHRFRHELDSIFGPPPIADRRLSGNDKTTAPEKGGRSIGDFARENGLDSKPAPDKKLELSLQYNGEKLVIGRVPDSPDGLKEIKKDLKEFTDLKQWELENKYGIKIARPGEPGPRQQIVQKDNSIKFGKELAVRNPSLKELLGMEAALEKSAPANTSGNAKEPVKFYFLKDQSYNPEARGAAAFEPDINGGPAVIVDPGFDRNPITERDRKNNDGSDHGSMESILTHELGHHTEEKLLKTPEAKSAFYKELGWRPVPGSQPGQEEYMLRGRHGDYKPINPMDPEAGWEKLNRHGRTTGIVNQDQVAADALVKPATGYFVQPHEMLAESLTLLRLGNNHRSHLLNTDPRLHNLIKGLDQKEIDMKHGRGRMIRSFSGALVPNTPDNQRLLLEKEKQYRR
ncbi:MAG: hypothetical protein KC777_25510 [Cyanobacteria bacterium HKST-UBA02]|nr:hypothetical protein [Cyanobacteria bacterium HKST-UBA02]